MAWFSTLILLFLAAPALPSSPAEATGFSASLIHRDHPKSYLHDPTATHYERQRQAILGSFARAKYLQSRISNSGHREKVPTSVIIPDNLYNRTMFLMDVSIGSPPFKIQALVDTGSDLMWTQCSPCIKCFNQTAPVFKPSESTTYRKLSCESEQCRNLHEKSCDETKHCKYEYWYSLSSTIGDLAAETLTFRSTSGGNISIPTIAFGCGYKNVGGFRKTWGGIIGLGRGPLSIVKQMDKLVRGRFSYCLPGATNSSGEIRFGSSAVVSGRGTVSTPLYRKKPPNDKHYYVNLQGLSLAHEPHKKSYGNYSIVIDSGSLLSSLPENMYNDLASAIRRNVSFPVVEDPEGYLDLCFQTTAGEGSRRGFPDLVFHFAGADVAVPASSAFLGIKDGVVCLSFTPTSEEPYVIGNTVQKNYHVGFDLEAEKVSFKQAIDCSKTTLDDV